jgi:hypothetical protein
MSVAFSRADKLTDGDTILYEIDMVRFAASRLLRGKWESEKDQWACLESFLVHYRNLIEFLWKGTASRSRYRPSCLEHLAPTRRARASATSKNPRAR